MINLDPIPSSTNSEELVDKLVTDNLKLAHFYAAKAQDIDRDQAFSLAMEGLLRAAQRHDQSLGAPFGSYAALCIKHALGHYRKRLIASKRGGNAFIVSLNDSVGENGDAELGDFVADTGQSAPDQVLLGQSNLDLLSEALRHLELNEARLISRRFGLGNRERETLEEISQIAGVTHQAIRYREARAMLRLQKIIRELEAGIRRPCKRRKLSTPAGMYDRGGILSRVEALLKTGISNRAVCRQLGLHRDTVGKYRRHLEAASGVILCACGLPSKHRGWCSHRFSQSVARQDFIKGWRD